MNGRSSARATRCPNFKFVRSLLLRVWHEIGLCGYKFLIGLVCLCIVTGIMKWSRPYLDIEIGIACDHIAKLRPVRFFKDVLIPNGSIKIKNANDFERFNWFFNIGKSSSIRSDQRGTLLRNWRFILFWNGFYIGLAE